MGLGCPAHGGGGGRGALDPRRGGGGRALDPRRGGPRLGGPEPAPLRNAFRFLRFSFFFLFFRVADPDSDPR